MASRNVYVVGEEGELIFPGDRMHALMDLIHSMNLSQQRKALELARRVVSGKFDILKTANWTDAQRRAFMESLPEATP